MNCKKWILGMALGFSAISAQAQVTGGARAMEFLRLPNSPHISAMGGMNVSGTSDDIAFALQNPALMRPSLHNQLGLNYNIFYAGTGLMNLQYGYHAEKIKTSFALGVQYLNYGNFVQTDDIGNQYGNFHATDYAVSLTAARNYGMHWRYGATLKWAHSSLFDKSANALLADVGVNYCDTESKWNVGITAKNMGFMLKNFTKGNNEPLPFDLQVGISKQFKHIPFKVFTTIHHLYTWDVRYDNPADVQTSILTTGDTTTKTKSHFADKLFRHFIFGVELTFAKRVSVIASYNHLHRGELALADKGGMAGFSFGAVVLLNKFQVYYARSYYSTVGAYNQFGLNMSLNRLFGNGKTGENTQWNAVYPNELGQ